MPKKKEKKHCQYESFFGEPCPHDYFATYAHPETGEDTDCCIFHAPMEHKKDKIDEFWEAFEAYFDETESKFEAVESEEEKQGILLDCQGFVFPDTGDRFESKEFSFSVSFSRATFSGEAFFNLAMFSGEAFFDQAMFSGGAYFFDATFSDGMSFYRAKFSGKVYFFNATFSGEASFFSATFSGKADFGYATLSGKAIFNHATFSGEASFFSATFSGEAYFRDATFSGEAFFVDATFSGEAYFEGATFSGKAQFGASISGKISFLRATFDENVSFQGASLTGELKFPETEFCKSVDLRDVRMVKESDDGEVEGPGALLFDNTYFHQPERVQIGGKECDLGQWSFKDTNIEEVKFVNEKWDRRVRRRGKYEEAPLKLKLWPFKLNSRKVVYDEILANEDKDKTDYVRWVTREGDYKRITWGDAGQVYRRLRKNFENELAYELTSDFHFGQMECRRLNSDRPLLHPDRVVAFLYKIVSGYGERFGLPLLWLLGSFFVFTGAFMFLGYRPAGENEVIWRFCSPGEMFASGFWSWVLDLGKAVTFTLRAAVSFRLEDITKDPVIFLAHMWKLFAVVFATFFILGLRRRFKK